MDLLVKLYSLDLSRPAFLESFYSIRRVMAPELKQVSSWVERRFSQRWASEAMVAFSRQPPSCFIALKETRIVGFACYDTMALGFFGPTGVHESDRRQGIGRALLFACLADMRTLGYGYAVIGAAGPVDYYAKAVGAIRIPDSSPGLYAGLLPRE